MVVVFSCFALRTGAIGDLYFDPGNVAVKTVYNAKNEVIARLEYTALDVKSGNGASTVRGKTVKIKNNSNSFTK